MNSLAQKLSHLVGDAFEAQGLDRNYGAVKVSDRPDLAQFQCNGAMAAAKAARKNPREVAQAVASELHAKDMFAKIDHFGKIEVAGPGFINLNVTDEFLSQHLRDSGEEDHFGVRNIGQSQTVILDYGGPNIAKAMHVGHLRAAIIGDSIRRIMAFTGYKTFGDVHMGDWGTHMGMLIDDYLRQNQSDLVTSADLSQPRAIENLMNDMADRYPKAAAAAKGDPALMERAQQTTVKLQNKEESYYAIWNKIRDVSVRGIKKNYDALGVHFDLWKGEADVHDYIAPMVATMRNQGYAIESDGAVVIPVASNDDKKEMPPLILYKRDGAVMYGTTDLATIIERVKLYNPARIVYIVDQRQSLHFEQVFRAARMAKLVEDDIELTHAGFGTMNGPDGKPFKTREGGVMRLEDLIGMAEEKALIRMDEANLAKDMSTGEKELVAHKVALAAIKFADLQNARQADYVFDLERLTSFEGKTGPYMLYQAVRIRSLLGKAGHNPMTFSPLVLKDADRPLALVLTEFPDAVEAALKNYAPHFLCEYAYRLAQTFSSFYASCHILSEQDLALKNSRLTLCSETFKTLELTLLLLGIDLPERM